MAWDNESEGMSPEYRRNRPLVLARDQHQCQLRWRMCVGVATEVDHKRNRKSGGNDVMSNLQAVCKACHAAKTSWEQRKAREKKKQDLRHSWTRVKHPGLE